jgi:Flp pilus assembly protein TadD
MISPGRSDEASATRRLAWVALVALLAGGSAGCANKGLAEPQAALAMASAPQNSGDPRGAAAAWGERYRVDPRNPVVVINYAQALRTLGQRAQAASVLEQATILHPKNMELLGAYGRALADLGNFEQALDVLSRAHTPDRPDWRILSVQGAVLDQMGRHDDARRYYATALKIVPEESSVLSNLGLSYALSKDLPQAEAILRRAAAARATVDPRVRQNLALVIGLQGRFADAEAIARADLPPEEAAANVAYLRKMLAQQNALQKRGPPNGPRG